MGIVTFTRMIILLSLIGCMYITDNNASEVSDLKSELGSLSFAGLDFYKNTVNLTPLPANERDTQAPQMRLDDYRDGFVVAHGMEYFVGIGPSMIWYYENITNLPQYLWKYIGIGAVLDKNVEFMSYVDRKENIKKITKKKKIPYIAQEVQDWTEGDSVFFQTSGGIAFTGKIGAYGLGVGPTFVVSGGWGVYVEKMEGNKVFAQIMHGKVLQAHLVAGTYIAEVSAGSIKEFSKGFSYAFDLNNESAARSYEDLLKGNAIPSQLMTENASNPFVVKIDTVIKHKLSSVRKFSIGIPLINYTAKKERYFEHIDRATNLNGSTTETYLIGNQKQTYSQLINKHRMTRHGFYAGLKIDKSETWANIIDYAGSFSWQYSSDYTTKKKLTRALKRLVKKTGLSEDLTVTLPQGKSYKYTSVTYSMDLSYAYINYLQNSKSRANIEGYGTNALSLLEKYFEQYSDPLNLCLAHLSKTDWLGCKQHNIRLLERNLKKMDKALSTMKELRSSSEFFDKSSSREYVKNLSEFGSGFTSNVFLFKAIYTDAQKCGLVTNYKIEGERLSRFVKEKQFKMEKSCIVSF